MQIKKMSYILFILIKFITIFADFFCCISNKPNKNNQKLVESNLFNPILSFHFTWSVEVPFPTIIKI